MSSNNESFRLQFGRRLAAARRHVGVSQDDLALSTGIARGTLSRYERGELIPTAEVMAALVVALGHEISADWLLFGIPEDLERPEPIILDNFGTLIRLGFGRRGTADVTMGSPEVKRVFEACVAFELRKTEPNQLVLDRLKFLLDYYAADDYAEGETGIELLARVVIAQNSVRLEPEIPEIDAPKERGNEEIRDAMERLYREETEVTQTISGSNHQIAGRDLVIKGDNGRRKK